MLLRETSAGMETPLIDALGSIIQMTNPAQATVASYSYDAYGNTTQVGTDSNSQQYTGRENDGTGLYYFRARYYSAVQGRFISQDPLGWGAGQSNGYTYVHDNPVQKKDPMGLDDTKQCKQNFLTNNYGNFVNDWLVPNLSLESYLPNSPNFSEAWGTTAEAFFVKGGALGGLGLAANFFENRAASTIAIPASEFGVFGTWIKGSSIMGDMSMANLLNGIVAGTARYASLAGVGLTAFATTADALATYHCSK